MHSAGEAVIITAGQIQENRAELMKRVFIDDLAARPFAEAADAVQVCTQSGQFLGYFTPARDDDDELERPCSEDELHDRVREGGGRPLTDILRELEKRS
jgi:hypothetical protein